MDLMPAFQLAPEVKAMINLGAGLDIPTGKFLPGKYGEYILNAGLGNLTGVVGIGNNFKSTFLHFMCFTAMCRMRESTGSIYDTEINVHREGLRRLYKALSDWDGTDWLDIGRFRITDKTKHTADEWYVIMREWMVEKAKEKKFLRETPFLDSRGELIHFIIPTFTEIDSFAEFISTNALKMQQEHAIGDKETNMLNMQQGRAKSQFLMDIPAIAQSSYNYFLLTAHVGDEFVMDPRNPPKKKLAHMPQGQKIKGAPEKFTFVMNNCWHNYGGTPLQNGDTKAPEYPRDTGDNVKNDTDLNLVKIKQLRGKAGGSGATLEMIFSQSEGLLPSLTEYHHMRQRREGKSDKRYGFSGNNVNFEFDLLPGVALSRTAIRGKIDAMPKLRRALNIGMEMCQMSELWHDLPDDLLCTPKELYDDLKAKGYDWEVLLGTRGWWTYENDKHPIPFLSTMDLLRMRQGLYHPYWMAPLK